MTKKERIDNLLVHAKATAKIYRELANKLVWCADSLDDARNTEWSALPNLNVSDMTRAIEAGLILNLMIRQARSK